MYTQIAESCIAFEGSRCIAKGDILDVVQVVKSHIDADENASILIFDEATARIVEVDFRGGMADVRERLEVRTKRAGEPVKSVEPETRKPGRPKLGVVSREITLLPRHWEWLGSQPGGASVTLRKLVEEARKRNSGKDRIRKAQEIAYRFMNAIAGDLPGYEEALRALYAGDSVRFEEYVGAWPEDIRDHTLTFAKEAFSKE
jgi:hypothetical protein